MDRPASSAKAKTILIYVGAAAFLILAMLVIQIYPAYKIQKATRGDRVRFSETAPPVPPPEKFNAQPDPVVKGERRSVALVKDQPTSATQRGGKGSMDFLARGRAPSSKPQGSMGYLTGDDSIRGVAGKGNDEADFKAGRLDNLVRSIVKNGAKPVTRTLTGPGGTKRFGGQVLRSYSQWRLFNQSVTSHVWNPPDFRTEMAIVVFAGTVPEGTDIQIVSAKPQGRKFVVDVKIRKPERDSGGAMEPRYELKVVPKSNLKPVFRRLR